MPFYKKAYNSKQKVHYPRAIVQGKPVETETIAKDLAKISTVSNSDVQAVLGDIARCDAHSYGTRQERSYQRIGLFPLHP